MAKKFFYVCAGILMLAGAYAIGTHQPAQAQSMPGDVVQAFEGKNNNSPVTVVVTAGGAFFARAGNLEGHPFSGARWGEDGDWTYMGNCFDSAVSSESSSLGGVKSQYR